MKFIEEMKKIGKELKKMGFSFFIPPIAKGVDYWAKDNSKKVKAKKELGLISEYMKKIEKSDAILVVNITKGKIRNYIGANTFLEMGFAHYRKKKIYILNPLPKQDYIIDELLTFEPIVINGKLNLIK